MEHVVAAEFKLKQFRSLKEEIDCEMARAQQILDDVRKKIRENTTTEENPEPLLGAKEEDYLACLVINFNELERLFRQDEAMWEVNLSIKVREAIELKEKLQAFLTKQQGELAAFLNKSINL